jgi:hypothetical protein
MSPEAGRASVRIFNQEAAQAGRASVRIFNQEAAQAVWSHSVPAGPAAQPERKTLSSVCQELPLVRHSSHRSAVKPAFGPEAV